jgi:hypothetical protein
MAIMRPQQQQQIQRLALKDSSPHLHNLRQQQQQLLLVGVCWLGRLLLQQLVCQHLLELAVWQQCAGAVELLVVLLQQPLLKVSAVCRGAVTSVSEGTSSPYTRLCSLQHVERVHAPES